MNLNMPHLLLTPEEVAEALRIGRTRVYRLIGDEVIPSVLIGRSRRVPFDALQQYVRTLVAAASNDEAE